MTRTTRQDRGRGRPSPSRGGMLNALIVAALVTIALLLVAFLVLFRVGL